MQIKLTKSEVETMRAIRWKARTDLLFLCNNILGYTDVNEEVHGPVIEKLQKFQKPSAVEYEENDKYVNGQWQYIPVIPHQILPGTRRMVYLDPRGHLKTSINTIAHTIQFIINYPNIACMISVANTERAKLLLKEILEHFTLNSVFRRVFPEHCPTDAKADMFGRQDGFTSLARDFSYESRKVRREPTVHLGTIEKAVASLHFDVLKFSDIVDEENSQTREQCQKIIASYSAKLPAVVTPHESWVYIEGTRYHNEDLYGYLMANEALNRAKGNEKVHDIFMRGCFKKKDSTYDLEDLDEELHPFLRDENGNLMPIFPKKFPLHALMMLKNDPISAITFNEQYLNDPTPQEDSPLPTGSKLPSYIDPKIFHEKVKIAYYEIAVDFAETVKRRSDNSALTVMAWDLANRPYVVEMLYGKFSQEENVAFLVKLYKKYKAQLIYIEDTSYTRGLFPTIDRAFKLQSLFPRFEFLHRPPTQKKTGRIEAAVGAWWKSGALRFVYSPTPGSYPQISVNAMNALRSESRSFPRGANDDALDTLADLLSQKTYFHRLGARDFDDPDLGKSEFEKWLNTEGAKRMQEDRIYGQTLPAFAQMQYGEYGEL